MRVLMLILTLVLMAQRGGPQQTGVLAGQLNTTDGKPAAGIRVAAMVVPESSPVTAASTLASIVQTDASGRYRLEGLPFGRYYIVAGQVEFPTYYPGVAMIGQATPVTVTASSGPENLAFNFALSRGMQDGVIEVLITAAGAPLRGAQVSLVGPTAAAVPGTPANAAVTDADGKATFQNLFPGSYTVRAQMDGYLGTLPANIIAAIQTPLVPQPIATAPATIVPGQPPQKIGLALTKGYAIGGTITDTGGTPVFGLRVSAAILTFTNGRPTLSNRASSTTDDRGQYRLFWFGAGEYYIIADSAAQRGAQTGDTFQNAYYPGTTNLAEAKPVVVRNGDSTGNDFKILRVRNYRVTGKVLNPPARTLPNGQVDSSVPSFAYTPRDPKAPDFSLAPPLIPNRARSQTGEFDIMLPVGEWNLFAVIPNTTLQTTPGTFGAPPAINVPRYSTGRTAIDVVDRDIDGITISIHSSNIKGRVVMPATGTTANIQLVRPSLQPRESVPAPLIAQARIAQQLGANGEFEFPGVPPGSYNLALSLPGTLYVADIRLGQKSIMNDGILNVGTDPLEPLEVILGSGAATISATLRGITPETTLAQIAATRVVVAPDAPRRNNALLFRVAPLTTLNGTVFFSGIAPGSYKVFVLVGLPFGSEQDPEVLRKYEDRGTPITIAPGQTTVSPVQIDWNPEVR